MRACKCPNCGANLSVDDTDREFMFCEYCGARIDLVDRRTIHTERIVDDAKIKNAENISRIVNIFAAPVEERQRQKEFERQRQAEAERQEYERKKRAEQREYERQKQKEADRRANAEAVEDGCAAVAGGCLVKCAKHPVIACIIIFLLLGSCIGSGSSSSSASSSKATSTSQMSASSSSELEMYSDKYLAKTTYPYDVAYTRISEDGNNTRYYYLVGYNDHVVTFISSKNDYAIIGSFRSGDLVDGITVTWQLPAAEKLYTPFSRTLKYSTPNSDTEIFSIEDDGESYLFTKVSVEDAENALYQSDKIYDYSGS